MPLDLATVHDLQHARCADPFAHLGIHPGSQGWEIRAWLPQAREVTVIPNDGGTPIPLRPSAPGLFEAPVPNAHERFAYRLQVVDQNGRLKTEADPYDFGLLLEDWDLARLAEGRHYNLAEHLGAHPMTVGGVPGVRFAVWAPRARRVSVIGDWNGFDGRQHPMRRRDPYGVWELFLPGLQPGERYKYEIWGEDGQVKAKADPYALEVEVPPATASLIPAPSTYTWGDDVWLAEREAKANGPLSIYEVHAGSWRRAPNGDRLSYADMARDLVAHCTAQGFTHVEFLPLAAHPFEGSWGYQGSGWYAPNSRHGSPDDLRAMIDMLHQAGLGVIVDWVPAHYPKDDFALARFDGSPCYEYADPKEGEHRDWGTLIFNWRRREVRNFLLASALHWVREFHVDGLRVDAVSSMLYRNYSRKDGEWVANEYGGHENLEAVDFLKEFNATVHDQFPGVLTIAEESTAWRDITTPLEYDGLGFDLKWNMGWMHDTLRYLNQDPMMRPGCHDWITFHQWYAYDERWVLPLSHDEVVHGKGSLLGKLPGDYSAQCAQLRLLLAYQIAVPGRPLLFQGGEWGQGREWAWERSADWHEAETPMRQATMRFHAACNALYREQPALWAADDQREGFRWVDCENRQESMLAFLRQAPGESDVLVLCNFTPVPRPDYPLGVPTQGAWSVALSSADYDRERPGTTTGTVVQSQDEEIDGWAGVVRCDVPAFGVLFLTGPEPTA